MVNTLLALGLALQAAAPQPKFDSGRAWEHLRQLVAIGPRPSGSPAIEQTRKYIKSRLAAAGLVARAAGDLVERVAGAHDGGVEPEHVDEFLVVCARWTSGPRPELGLRHYQR